MYIRSVNNLKQRVASSLIMVIVFGAAVAVHHYGLLLTFGLLVFLTATEYIAMVKPGNRIEKSNTNAKKKKPKTPFSLRW